MRSRHNVVNNCTGSGDQIIQTRGPPDGLSTIPRIASFCVILTLFFHKPPPFRLHSNQLFQPPSSRNLVISDGLFMPSKYTFLSFFLSFSFFCFSSVFTLLFSFSYSSSLLPHYSFSTLLVLSPFCILHYSSLLFFYCHF